MDAEAFVRIVLYLVLVATCATAIWALLRIVKAADSLRVLTDDLHRQLPPLAEKATVTLDSINAEVTKVDGIVTQIEEVSDRVDATARTAEELLSVPVAAVSGLGGGVRRFVSVLLGRHL